MIITGTIDLIRDITEIPSDKIRIWIRFLLNKKGFKFEDDDRLSAAFNDNPIPIGVLKWYDDSRTMLRHYKQVIPE